MSDKDERNRGKMKKAGLKNAHLKKEEEQKMTRRRLWKNSAKYAHLAKEEEQKMTRREKKPHCPLGLGHLDAGAEVQSGRTPRPLDLKFTQQQNIKKLSSAPVELLVGGCSQLLERNIPTHY